MHMATELSETGPDGLALRQIRYQLVVNISSVNDVNPCSKELQLYYVQSQSLHWCAGKLNTKSSCLRID